TEIENQKKDIIESELENTQGIHALEVLAQQKANIRKREEELTDTFNKEFNNKTEAINEKGLAIIDEIELTEEEIKLAEDGDPDDFSTVTLFLLRVRLTLLTNKLKSLQKEADSLKDQKEGILEAQKVAYRKSYDEIRDAIINNEESTDEEKLRIIRKHQTGDLIQLQHDYLLNQLDLDKAGLYCMAQLEKIKKGLPVRKFYEIPLPEINTLTPPQIIKQKEAFVPTPKKRILPFGRPQQTVCQNGICPAAYPCLPV
ncbi:MAG: hypothetical protein Q7R63_02715, partial [bacterium]|nr:hypothetical protein [bacterium]